MPSFLVGNPLASGPTVVVSGFPWSGKAYNPVGGIQFRVATNASGSVYIGYSGTITMNSGGLFMSGGGMNDGMQLAPGDAFFVPRLATGVSGALTVYFRHDAACSGQTRIYYDLFSWMLPVAAMLLPVFGGLMSCV